MNSRQIDFKPKSKLDDGDKIFDTMSNATIATIIAWTAVDVVFTKTGLPSEMIQNAIADFLSAQPK